MTPQQGIALQAALASAVQTVRDILTYAPDDMTATRLQAAADRWAKLLADIAKTEVASGGTSVDPFSTT
jgi:leucyl aminopeptidase